MNAQQYNMDVIANNLANVNTTGFKKSRADFQDLLSQTMKVPGSPTSPDTESPTGIEIGLGTRLAAVSKNFTQGDLILTENEMDVAIEGEGFFQVQLPDGETAYTRSGAFKRDSQGRLTTSEGYLVLPQITIPDTSSNFTINTNGEVSVTIGASTEATVLGTLQLATFTNDQGLLSMGQNILRESPSSGAAILNDPGTDGYGTLLQTYLEGSNVNIIEEMANMIVSQRAYEINSNSIQTSDEMMQTTNNLAG
jgi:flagellar basal-body rod protein FlgG